MKTTIYKTLLAGSVLLTSSTASAVSLTIADDYIINGTTSAARPELAGVIIEDLISSYSFTGTAGQTLQGSIQNRVVRSVDGTLDFYWRIRPTGGNAEVTAFRLGGFEGFALDADWRIDGLGSASPDIARYFGPGTGNVNFLFETDPVGVDPTGNMDDSVFFFLDTDALFYDQSGQFDLLCAGTGCVSSGYNTFAPSAVPVPAAVWLFGSGLIGLLGIARRKNSV